MGLRDEFLDLHGGDRIVAAISFAERLMVSVPEEYKAGYTAENALLATEEVFGLERDEFCEVGKRIGADDAFIERHAKTKPLSAGESADLKMALKHDVETPALAERADLHPIEAEEAIREVEEGHDSAAEGSWVSTRVDRRRRAGAGEAIEWAT